MSLWRWKTTLVRAVAGELSATEELRLREHLRGCAACESFYDRLVQTEERLANLRRDVGGGLGSGASSRSAAREEARLREALGVPALAPSDTQVLAGAPVAPKNRKAPTRHGFPAAWASSLLLPVAAALFLWLRPTSPTPSLSPTSPMPSPSVTWRGGPTREGDGEAAHRETLLVYASRKLAGGKHAPVRLVGEMPGSGESRAFPDDYVQLALRNLTSPAFAMAVALTDEGRQHLLWPTAGQSAKRLEAAQAKAVPLGPSIDLASASLSGHLRLCVMLFETAPEPTSLAALLPRACEDDAPAPPSVRILRGLLIVGP